MKNIGRQIFVTLLILHLMGLGIAQAGSAACVPGCGEMLQSVPSCCEPMVMDAHQAEMPVGCDVGVTKKDCNHFEDCLASATTLPLDIFNTNPFQELDQPSGSVFFDSLPTPGSGPPPVFLPGPNRTKVTAIYILHCSYLI